MSFYVCSLISAYIYDVKTGFYDVTYINKWCHYNENAVTLIYMGIKNKAPRAVTAFEASLFMDIRL